MYVLEGYFSQQVIKVNCYMYTINWSAAIASNFSCFFTSKIAKIGQDKCSHCAMTLDYCFRLLSTALSHGMITQCVHPFRVIGSTEITLL